MYKNSQPLKCYLLERWVEGEHPLGSDNSRLFELRTHKGAIARAKRAFPNDEWKLFTYWPDRFYHTEDHKLIAEMSHEYKGKNIQPTHRLYEY